jgi:hypothetical protein
MPQEPVPLPPGSAWTGENLTLIGNFIMSKMNPYQPHTAPKPTWRDEFRRDDRQLLWTFREAPVRVESALEIPYHVWYRKRSVPYPKPANPAHWEDRPSTEYLLVGYVGSGGY